MNKNTQENKKLKELLILVAVIGGVVLVLLAFYFVPKWVRDYKNRPPDAHHGTMNENKEDEVIFTNSETGIGYIRCPIGLGANTVKSYPYMTIEGSSIKLYEIDYQEPTQFISEAKNALLGSYVYRAEETELPTLDSFAPIAADIYKGDFQTGSFYSAEIAAQSGGKVEDGTKYVNAIKEALNGSAAELTGEMSDEDEFSIKLLSKTYPGLYYELMFFTDENGVAYISDLVTGKTVKSPDIITVRMLG